GVQRAVIVALGSRDVVVEFARDDRPQAMHHPEYRVAVRHAAGEHAQRADVVQLAEADLLALHLPPDGIDVLGPAIDAGLDALCDQRLPQLRDAAGDPVFAIGAT